MEKFGDDGGAKGVSSAARGEEEFVAVGVGVGPDEVGHGAFVGDFWVGGLVGDCEEGGWWFYLGSGR